MQKRTTKRTAVIAATTVAMLLAGAAMALAGAGGSILVLPTDEPGDRSTATFDFEFGDLFRLGSVGQVGLPGEPPCDEVETYRLWEIDQDPPGIGDLVIDGVAVSLEGDDPWQGSFTLTDVPGGWYLFEVVCPDGGDDNGSNGLLQEDGDDIEPGPFGGDLGFARLLVEVEVEGDVPEGTAFEVEVECQVHAASAEPMLIVDNGAEDEGSGTFTVTRTFDATGGTEQVVLYEGGDPFLAAAAEFDPTVGDIPAECTVTQTDDGGAESTTSSPPANSPVTVDIDERDDYTVTFTNIFPTEDEEDEEEPVEVDDEAEPAEPVEAEPDFAG